LYKEMLVEGVTPDHHTFDILLMTCWKQRKFELANELFDKAVQLNADNKGKLVRTAPFSRAVPRQRFSVLLTCNVGPGGARHASVQLGVEGMHQE
jgi:hypothetical protein